MDDIEEWRPVPGYEGYYSISSFGNLRSEIREIHSHRNFKRTFPGKILTPREDKYGYMNFEFSRSGKTKQKYIHQLLMLAFVGPRPEGWQVCHNDGNTRNNKLINLRYGTPLENAADKVRHGTQLHGEGMPQSKLMSKQVKNIIKDARTQEAIAVDYGVHQGTISKIKNGKLWRTLGRTLKTNQSELPS